jgi:membrane protease subunit (stomatin/prohibitin family)
MKKTILTLAGILALGTTTLVADGSSVTVNENIMLNVINDSKIENSTVGINIQAKGSTVEVNENIMLNVINSSEIKDSTIGIAIVAE